MAETMNVNGLHTDGRPELTIGMKDRKFKIFIDDSNPDTLVIVNPNTNRKMKIAIDSIISENDYITLTSDGINENEIMVYDRDHNLKSSGTTIEEINSALDALATYIQNLQNIIRTKVTKSDTLAGYGITNAFTKTEVTELVDEAIDNIDISHKVNVNGDTMTGPLTLSGVPTAVNHAATKNYVDTHAKNAEDNAKNASVSKGGDTMTGYLTLSGDPVNDNHASTKSYVDTTVSTYVPKSGTTMTGPLTLSGNPTDNNHAANKKYVDDKVGGYLPITGGTMTGPIYSSRDPEEFNEVVTINWCTQIFESFMEFTEIELEYYLQKSGGTMTGPITLSGNPTANNHAANKSYVDNTVANYVPKSGTTMTGALTLNGAPTATNHAATKGYVDTTVGNYVPKSGGTMTGALTLSGAPSSSNHAATKSYVDGKIKVSTSAPTSSTTGNPGDIWIVIP